MTVPPHLRELVAWFVETVIPLADENGWSVTVNGNAGTAITDVRVTQHTVTEQGETRIEKRTMRRFRLKAHN